MGAARLLCASMGRMTAGHYIYTEKAELFTCPFSAGMATCILPSSPCNLLQAAREKFRKLSQVAPGNLHLGLCRHCRGCKLVTPARCAPARRSAPRAASDQCTPAGAAARAHGCSATD